MYIKVDMNIVNFVMRKRSCLAVLVLAIVHWTAHGQSFDVKVQELIPHPKGNYTFQDITLIDGTGGPVKTSQKT